MEIIDGIVYGNDTDLEMEDENMSADKQPQSASFSENLQTGLVSTALRGISGVFSKTEGGRNRSRSETNDLKPKVKGQKVDQPDVE